MRTLDVGQIREIVRRLVQETNVSLGDDVLAALRQSLAEERSPLARDILEKIEQNIEIAAQEGIPLCQDTGLACVFLEVGQDVHLTGGGLYDAVNEGIRLGYDEGFLRKSVVGDPINRVNTKDNTPGHIHVDIVPGDKVKVTVAPKGFGSENMSRIRMLPPSAGVEGVKDFVLQVVREAGGNPCPPVVLGIGIGGTFDGVALLAKKALLLPLDHQNEDPYYAALEEELLAAINKLDVGPQGFGGDTTCLGLNILTAPTHIAGLPVAVNVNCHVSRHREAIL